MTIRIELSESQEEKLRDQARRLGVEPQALAHGRCYRLVESSSYRLRAGGRVRGSKEPRVLQTSELMRHINLAEVVEFHHLVIESSGGSRHGPFEVLLGLGIAFEPRCETVTSSVQEGNLHG
jgi:hypothetical protein